MAEDLIPVADPSAEPPVFCECAQCEFADPDVDLGYALYVDPDYLKKRQQS